MSEKQCRCEACWWPMYVIGRLPDPLYRAVMRHVR